MLSKIKLMMILLILPLVVPARMRVAAQQDIAQVERAGTDFAGRKVEASHVGEDLADRDLVR